MVMMTRVKSRKKYLKEEIYSESTGGQRWWKSWGFIV